jgi:hypothetical protein
VGGHHRVDPGVDGPDERHQFQGVQSCAVTVHHREAHVGVDVGIPVPRKVLAGGERSSGPRPANERSAETGDEVGVSRERPRGNDRIVGVVVDVENGSEQQVYPGGPGFGRGDAAVLVGEPLVPDGSERHGGRKRGSTTLRQHGRQGIRPVDAHPRAAVLEVRPNEERNLGPLLECVELRHVGVRQSDAGRHSSDAILDDPSLEGLEVRRRR